MKRDVELQYPRLKQKGCPTRTSSVPTLHCRLVLSQPSLWGGRVRCGEGGGGGELNSREANCIHEDDWFVLTCDSCAETETRISRAASRETNTHTQTDTHTPGGSGPGEGGREYSADSTSYSFSSFSLPRHWTLFLTSWGIWGGGLSER